MAATKTEWHKPELVVLVRSRPEEAVLRACKGSQAFGPPEGLKNCKTHGSRCETNVKS